MKKNSAAQKYRFTKASLLQSTANVLLNVWTMRTAYSYVMNIFNHIACVCAACTLYSVNGGGIEARSSSSSSSTCSIVAVETKIEQAMVSRVYAHMSTCTSCLTLYNL